MIEQQVKPLKFGDPESIAIRDKFREDKEKELAVVVEVTEEEVEREPEYEYSWKCPHCGREENCFPDCEMPNDKLIKCYECKKWLKLKI